MSNLKNFFTSNKFKLILVLIIVYFFASFLSSQIFFAGTPRIKPDALANLTNIPSEFLALFKSKNSGVDLTFPSEQLFNTISTGVKAYDDKEKNVVYIKYEKNAKFEKKILKAPNGREFQIYIAQ